MLCWLKKTRIPTESYCHCDLRGVKVQHEGCIFTTTLRPDLVKKANMEWKMLSLSWGMVQGVGFLCGVQLPLPSVTWNRAAVIKIIYVRKKTPSMRILSVSWSQYRFKNWHTTAFVNWFQSHHCCWQETVTRYPPLAPPRQISIWSDLKVSGLLPTPLVSASPFPSPQSKLKLWRWKSLLAFPIVCSEATQHVWAFTISISHVLCFCRWTSNSLKAELSQWIMKAAALNGTWGATVISCVSILNNQRSVCINIWL